MWTQDAKDIIAILPRGRTLFPYFKDRYALMLLEQVAGDGTPVRALREGPYGKLLNRPAVKELVARKGDGLLQAEDFATAWPEAPVNFNLTLDLWGTEKKKHWHPSQYQMARRGVNLVLQVNFDNQHNQLLKQLGTEKELFAGYWHPNARAQNTMGWVRLDVDLDQGEALIEELQSDWLRAAAEIHQRDLEVVVPANIPNERRLQRIQAYQEALAERYQPIWQETLLAAALFFIFEELGLSRAWIYEHRTGCLIKNIDLDYAPPRSLYTKLPKAFCFDLTDDLPAPILGVPERRMQKKRLRDELRFWRLDRPSPKAANDNWAGAA